MRFQTYSGRDYDIINPTSDMIDIKDIAHSLALKCRFNGHCDRFYSVAEHCVVMSMVIDQSAALLALMHDASETYLTDVISPVKRILIGYDELEGKSMNAIYAKFGVLDLCNYAEAYHLVKEADIRMRETERIQLMSRCTEPWYPEYQPYDRKLGCWSPDMAERIFIDRFKELMGED